jgi:hypothetical protein
MSPVSHQASSSFLQPSLSGVPTPSAHTSASVLGSYVTEDPLETRVVNISMEIAAAIAHAQAEDRSRERELSEDALESEEAEDTETGGNRREQEDYGTTHKPGEEAYAEGEVDEDSEEEERGEDAFPEPLRRRRGRKVGSKRKRH